MKTDLQEADQFAGDTNMIRGGLHQGAQDQPLFYRVVPWRSMLGMVMLGMVVPGVMLMSADLAVVTLVRRFRAAGVPTVRVIVERMAKKGNRRIQSCQGQGRRVGPIAFHRGAKRAN